MKKIIIAAVSQNNVIGEKAKIPWHCAEEMAHFKETTLGYPVIMGRKTFESIGKPLNGRLNIIITSHPGLIGRFEDLKCFLKLREAILFCESGNYEKIFIAGGAGLYNEAIYIADEMIISRMNFNVTGDRFFPEIPTDIWEKTENKKFTDFETEIYKRKKR